jgi:hypothetical protein
MKKFIFLDISKRLIPEIDTFKKMIDELLAEGYNEILGDVVGKNLAAVHKRGMIPYDLLNAGQLYKYLNSDC